MVQAAIEKILRQKLGLDMNSVGARLVDRAVEQRQNACKTRGASYLELLQSSSQELDCLIERVVVPETWFFRDQEPFVYLQNYLREWRSDSSDLLRVLSVPCSTGEEPYSIAMTLLDAGFAQHQFCIDAVDISQEALSKAKQAVYGKKSFRGVEKVIQRHFQAVSDGYEVRSTVRESVNFIRGNILEPRFLANKKYQVIFCRNLLIYLDRSARDQVMHSLDIALASKGILFLGAAETSQLKNKSYTPIDHPFAFAYRKEPPVPVQPIEKRAVASAKPAQSLSQALPKPVIDFSPKISQLEIAKQLADRGQLDQAAQLCESILRASPTQSDVYSLLGEVYQGLNQPKQAEQHFQKAIYLDPDAYEALIHLALLKEQQGDRATAQRLKQRAQRLAKSKNTLN